MIRNVNHAQIPTGFRLPNRNARTLAADSILDRLPENFFDFLLLDIVVVNVGLAGARIDVVPKPHIFNFTPLLLVARNCSCARDVSDPRNERGVKFRGQVAGRSRLAVGTIRRIGRHKAPPFCGACTIVLTPAKLWMGNG